MIRSLLDLSNKLDSLLISAFESIQKVSDSLEIPVFVVGASARDIILHHGYDIPVTRATQDIDIGVQVSSWNQYQKLLEGLLLSDNFEKARSAQRLFFKKELPVDLVPFGAIRDKNNNISWPPNHEEQMSVLGFEEVFQNAQTGLIKKTPEVIIRFATPQGLSILKILAWSDGPQDRKQKDAKDLKLILTTFLDAGNSEKLYTQDADLMDEKKFDYVQAGARLLGREISRIAKPYTRKIILEILKREIQKPESCRLALDMVKGTCFHEEESFLENFTLLKELKKGIEDIPPRK